MEKVIVVAGDNIALRVFRRTLDDEFDRATNFSRNVVKTGGEFGDGIKRVSSMVGIHRVGVKQVVPDQLLGSKSAQEAVAAESSATYASIDKINVGITHD